MAKAKAKAKTKTKAKSSARKVSARRPIQPPRGRERAGQAEGAPEAVIRGQPSPRRGF